jgi:hypothetical protein
VCRHGRSKAQKEFQVNALRLRTRNSCGVLMASGDMFSCSDDASFLADDPVSRLTRLIEEKPSGRL